MFTAIIFLLLCIVGMSRACKQMRQALDDHKYWLVVIDGLALVLGVYLLLRILTWILIDIMT